MDLGTKKILFKRNGSIGIITLNNPERRNAINFEMWKALEKCFGILENDDDVRVVILRGAGGESFGSGADISEFEALRKTAADAVEYDAQLEASRIAMRHFSKPMIALIEGYCLAGGLALAMYADIRTCNHDAIFGVPAARMGVAYTLESFTLLIQLIGRSRTADLLITARRISAASAYEMGLVNYVFDRSELYEATIEIAKQIAQNAPLSVRASKEIIEDLMKAPEDRTPSLAQKWRDRCHDSKDYAEGRKAFLEKRPANFQGC